MKPQIIATLAAGLTAMFLLSGCGLAETTAVAAAEAESAAQQVKQGKELEEKVKNDVEAAQLAAKEARDQAVADSQ